GTRAWQGADHAGWPGGGHGRPVCPDAPDGADRLVSERAERWHCDTHAEGDGAQQQERRLQRDARRLRLGAYDEVSISATRSAALCERRQELGHGLCPEVSLASLADTDGAGLLVAIANHQHVRHLLRLRIANLGLHLLR